jgi:hypothetical protein
MEGRDEACFRWVTLVALMFVGTYFVLGASFLGLNGHHVWRQADVLAQIEGFYGGKYCHPFQNYFALPVCYDIPIYQYVVAVFAKMASLDTLVAVRIVNFICFIVVLLVGQRYVETRQPGAWWTFSFLFSTSPLFLHYFSAPLPDVFCLALCVVALDQLRSRRIASILTGSTAFVLAAGIKSPVAFVFVVFYFLDTLLDGTIRGDRRVLLRCAIPPAAALFAALAAEYSRQLILGSGQLVDTGSFGWYFGTLAMRMQPAFYGKILVRTIDAFPLPALAIILFANVPLGCFLGGVRSCKSFIPHVVAFVSGWLVFSNVYFMHDYYELPVTLLLFFGLGELAAVTLSYIQSRLRLKFDDRLQPLVIVGLVLATLGVSASISVRRAPVFMDNIRYALRHYDVFLFVTDDTRANPAPGGLANTKFVQVSRQEYEAQCAQYMQRYHAVLVVGDSRCLRAHRHLATTFIQDQGLTFWAADPDKNLEPAIPAAFDADATARLSAAFTTDDPSGFASPAAGTRQGVTLSLHDLAYGMAVFNVNSSFGMICLRLLRTLRFASISGAEAALECTLVTDGAVLGRYALRRGVPVAVTVDLSRVEQLKLRFADALRTPYDVVHLQILGPR